MTHNSNPVVPSSDHNMIILSDKLKKQKPGWTLRVKYLTMQKPNSSDTVVIYVAQTLHWKLSSSLAHVASIHHQPLGFWEDNRHMSKLGTGSRARLVPILKSFQCGLWKLGNNCKMKVCSFLCVPCWEWAQWKMPTEKMGIAAEWERDKIQAWKHFFLLWSLLLLLLILFF